MQSRTSEIRLMLNSRCWSVKNDAIFKTLQFVYFFSISFVNNNATRIFSKASKHINCQKFQFFNFEL